MISNASPKTKVSCIIPVYNEASRIASVLDVVTNHSLIDEVIVINDGSTDNSETILKQRNDIHLITYPVNRGKSYAIMSGLKKARHDLILMVDSDLLQLNDENIKVLIEPILRDTADISISIRSNSLWVYKFFGLDFVSGERCFNKRIIGDLNQLGDLPGFGLETFLNTIIISKQIRIASIYWGNVIAPRKSNKFGIWAGTIGDLKMIGQIIKVTGFWGMVKQFRQMLKLKV